MNLMMGIQSGVNEVEREGIKAGKSIYLYNGNIYCMILGNFAPIFYFCQISKSLLPTQEFAICIFQSF